MFSQINWDNYDEVLEFIKLNGWALQFASEKLRANENIVLEAVKQNGYAIEYASEELRGNETFIAECLYNLYNLKKLQDINCVWRYVSEEIKEKYENQWEPLMASYYQRVQ